jgi:peptide/nickel transport system substrate-binding protein
MVDRNDPLSNLQVRQAVSYAIDTKAILDACLYGYGWVSNQWCLPGTPYYSNGVSGHPYNVQKAKELLSKAGYPNGFETRITLQAGWLEDGAQIIAEQLGKIGIKVNLNIVEVANYAGYIGSWEYGMLLHPMGATNGAASQMAANFVQNLPAGLGINAFLHPNDVDQLIKRAVASDANEAIGLFKQVADKIFEEYCMVKVIVVAPSVIAYRNELKDAGFNQNVSAASSWEKAWLE